MKVERGEGGASGGTPLKLDELKEKKNVRLDLHLSVLQHKVTE